MRALQLKQFLLLALVTLLQVPTQAEVQFDGTAGNATGLLSGDLSITESQGLLTADQQALLHSFSTFSIGAGETVEFTHATATVQNIIARVTGDNPSSIDGRLVSDTNFWLLNPNGVLTGEDAQIDVAGSFRTNDEVGSGAALILNDGSVVAVDTNLNTLSVAAPADFGFVADIPADASTSVSADPTSGTLVTPTPNGNGHIFDITGGTSVGGNLFHSFERFSVFADDTAFFTSNSAIAFDNVISRVTGDFKSFITGFVATDGSGMLGTSFWFVNPAGVFAGNGDSIDVAKSLNLGSADFISDSLGAEFRADAGGASTFFAGSPAGFGFDVDSQAQALRLSDLSYDQSGRLSNTASDGLSLAGSEVALSNSALTLDSNLGQAGMIRIDAPGGTVSLVGSVLSSLSQGAINAGSIELRGARLLANGSLIQMFTALGDETAAANRILLLFSDDISVQRSVLEGVTNGPGSSGRVLLSAPLIDVYDSDLATVSNASGVADFVGLQAVGDAARVLVAGDSEIANTTAQGTDGAEALGILIASTGDVALLGTEQANVLVTGNAGVDAGANASVEITGENVTFSYVDVASDSSGLTLAPGGSSQIEISANNRLAVESSLITTNSSGVNAAGSFRIAAREIAFVDSTISTATSGQGNAGLITLQADDQISLVGANQLISATTSTGSGSNLVLTSAGDILVDGALLTSSSTSTANGGSAGSILLQAQNDIGLLNSEVSATGVTGASGFAILTGNNLAVQSSRVSSDAMGDVSAGGIVAFLALDQLSIDDGVISTTTAGAADASDIVLQGLDIQVSNSEISGSTSGAGNASPINVSGPTDGATFDLSAEAEVVFTNTLVSSETTGDGSFGNITVFGRNVRSQASEFRVETDSLSQGDQEFVSIGLRAVDEVALQASTLSARTSGASDAGRITLEAPNINLSDSEVTNSSVGTGGAGRITLGNSSAAGPTSVALFDSVLTSDTLDGVGGQVNVAATTVILNGPNSRVSTNTTGNGTAGNVLIAANSLGVFDGASIESRATGQGDSNTINLQVGSGGFVVASELPGVRSEILTDSVQSQGGDVELNASGTTRLSNAAIVASAGASGTGGNVNLNVNGLLVGRSVVLAQAEAGNGGQIDINPEQDSVLIIDGESLINADSQAGSSGRVIIDAPDTGITSALTPQSADLAPEVSLQQDSCAPQADGQPASTCFVRTAGKRIKAPDAYLGGLTTEQTGSVVEPRTSGDCP